MNASQVNTQTPKGLLTRLVTSVFFRTAQVLANEELAPSLRRITLQGESLQQVEWAPGDKLQIRLGNGLQTRTYTPMEWDPTEGRTAFLAQTLSAGPGAQWATMARRGDTVEVMGPRSSLALDDLDPEYGVVMGDETALGVALAWGARRVVLEASDPHALAPVCKAWGWRCTLIAKQEDGSHLPAMEAAMWEGTALRSHFVLAGRASTIQRLHKTLRANGVQARRIHTKAYWADGKTGLD